MRYFKRKWDESRGDEYDSWGLSTWYIEVDGGGYPVRQLEQYDGGAILKYDETLLDDEFGGLGDQVLDLDDFAPFEIDAAAFEKAWSSSTARNRPMHETVEQVTNTTSATLTLVLEPWGAEVFVPPNGRYVVRARSKAPGQLEVERQDEKVISVPGWAVPSKSSMELASWRRCRSLSQTFRMACQCPTSRGPCLASEAG